ncbi:MAG: DUF2101 family protein [Methanobacterium sp.]|jgi:uncharacterized membrane protein
MKLFTIFGDLVIGIFNFVGMIILEIPNIPNRLKGINTDNIKDKVDPDVIKEKIYRIKNDNRIQETISKMGVPEIYRKDESDGSTIFVNDLTQNKQLKEEFTSEEKERTVFMLQIMSGAFLVISMLFIFNFLSLTLYAISGLACVVFIVYTLFSKIKLMYAADFNAYRDFFLMYVAVGLALVFVGTNPNFVMSFSFEFLPSLSVLIFAVISVAAVFLIFRIRYHRNFTYGTVIETGKKTAYVKVDYDICSNVKPDIYIVDNSYGADDGNRVKIQIEEKFLSMNGNKPGSIIEILN